MPDQWECFVAVSVLLLDLALLSQQEVPLEKVAAGCTLTKVSRLPIVPTKACLQLKR